MTTAIETRALTRRFGRVEAVRELTLSVAGGCIFALIGPNGAGKTTTIKLLMNLLRPTAGGAMVLGTDSRRLGIRDVQRIGYVSENQRLPGWMTPAELLDYCRPLYPTWDRDLETRLQRDLGLTGRVPLRKLSRGSRIKAALLSTLAYRPELVVLDEPFTGLDPLVRDELIRALLELPGERPWTVFISSHDIDEVERLADWIGFMSGGRLLFAEAVPALLTRFRTIEVVAAEGEAPQLPAGRDWLPQGRAGRVLRFIDTAHHRGPERIAAAFPRATIHAAPMPLREIFVALARASGAEEAR